MAGGPGRWSGAGIVAGREVDMEVDGKRAVCGLGA